MLYILKSLTISKKKKKKNKQLKRKEKTKLLIFLFFYSKIFLYILFKNYLINKNLFFINYTGQLYMCDHFIFMKEETKFVNEKTKKYIHNYIFSLKKEEIKNK